MPFKISGFSHWTWWFSIAMLVITRGSCQNEPVLLLLAFSTSDRSDTWSGRLSCLPKKNHLFPILVMDFLLESTPTWPFCGKKQTEKPWVSHGNIRKSEIWAFFWDRNRGLLLPDGTRSLLSSFRAHRNPSQSEMQVSGGLLPRRTPWQQAHQADVDFFWRCRIYVTGQWISLVHNIYIYTYI